MIRRWAIDFLSTLILAASVAGLVLLAGGPGWAATGFAVVYYLLRFTRMLDARR